MAIILCGTLVVSSAAAQPPVATQTDFRDRVVFGPPFPLERQLASLAQLRDAGRWREATLLIQHVLANASDAVVEAEPHRFLGVREWLHCELVTWPDDGIAVYRESVDPNAIAKYEEALARRDAAAMRTIVDDKFGSSVYDDACWHLAHWAWEDGDLTAAEHYWDRLVPRGYLVSADSDLRLAQYVESDYPPEVVLARLALCRVFLRDRGEAQAAVAAYSQRFSIASGTLAGADGPLAETLRGVIGDVDDWRDDAAQFDTRQVLGLAWTHPLRQVELESEHATPLDAIALRLPAHALLTNGSSLVVLSPHRVQVLDPSTGDALWPTGTSTDDGTVFSDPAGEASGPILAGSGIPRASGVINDGHLYATIGWPLLVSADGEIRELPSRIVGIDLEHGEGLVTWIAEDHSLLPQNWRFAGEPAVIDNRLLVPTTTTDGPIMLGLAALDADDGSLEWHREICGILDTRASRSHVYGRHVLRVSNGDVIWSTPFGCVLKLNADGRLCWAVAYAGENDGADGVSAAEPTVQNGMVFVPCPAASCVMAIDETHGVVRWTTQLRSPPTHILGAGNGVLVVGGQSLFGIDLSNGRQLWQCGFSDAEGAAQVSGVLTGTTAWWTTRDSLLGTDIATGAIVARMEIHAAWGLHGGPLFLGEHHLLLIEADRVSAISIR